MLHCRSVLAILYQACVLVCKGHGWIRGTRLAACAHDFPAARIRFPMQAAHLPSTLPGCVNCCWQSAHSSTNQASCIAQICDEASVMIDWQQERLWYSRMGIFWNACRQCCTGSHRVADEALVSSSQAVSGLNQMETN